MNTLAYGVPYKCVKLITAISEKNIPMVKSVSEARNAAKALVEHGIK